MKRVLLVLSLCLLGGLVASRANAAECRGGRCSDACPADADACHHSDDEFGGARRAGPVRRLLGVRPVRALFENRPVRRFLFGRCG
jgi:hypothetical protein